MTSLQEAYRIIQKPVITEKATDASATKNAYTFRVPRDVNKVQIRSAVERLFDVKVVQVNTLRIKPRVRRRGYSIGLTQEWKKAIVVLAEGQTIDVL